MRKKLRALYLTFLLDDRAMTIRCRLHELVRKLTFRKAVVSVFLQLDDPYSYLLGHYLAHVVQRYKDVEFRFYICQALRGEYMPQPALLAEYSIKDCRLLATEFGIPFLDKGDIPPVEYRRPLMEFLAAEHGEQDFGKTVINALTHYWRGDAEGVARFMGRTFGETAETNVLVGQNQLLLRKMGHYNCATMHFAGEWYWGIDRLYYLIERLDSLGLNRYNEISPELASLEQARQVILPATVPSRGQNLPALEFFYSFRSPYSYIALRRVVDVAAAFGLKIEFRPVLPMAMRGAPVPKGKIVYSLRDASREARRNNVPFGRVVDSPGPGIERCMAAFLYAKEQNRELDFLVEVGKAQFAEAVDVATDEGMQIVAKRCGLFWPELHKAMQRDAWRDVEKLNRESLEDSGLWGVPVFKIGDQAFWGQDRTWLLARKIEDMCDDGEGILI